MSKLSYPTAHIKATPEQIAETVLMPGDPKRSEKVAREFLANAQLFNNVRGVCGYTGEWKGERVSVMASGMGMPSIGIYSYELYNAFGVDNIIRIGSAGSLLEDVKVRDIVLGMGACADSSFGAQYSLRGSFAAIADFGLLSLANKIGLDKGFNIHVGNLLSSDIFYDDNFENTLAWRKMGVLAVEMEAAALYMNAARLGKKALAICTVSNSLVTGEELDADARENSFNEMIELALDVAVNAKK